MPGPAPFPINPYRVGYEKVAHEFTEVGLLGLHDQMEMIGHQHVGDEAGTMEIAAIRQS
jgi:hypothetical protein